MSAVAFYAMCQTAEQKAISPLMFISYVTWYINDLKFK